MYEICQLPNPFVAIQTIPEGNLLFYQACFTVEPSYVFVFDNLSAWRSILNETELGYYVK